MKRHKGRREELKTTLSIWRTSPKMKSWISKWWNVLQEKSTA